MSGSSFALPPPLSTPTTPPADFVAPNSRRGYRSPPAKSTSFSQSHSTLPMRTSSDSSRPGTSSITAPSNPDSMYTAQQSTSIRTSIDSHRSTSTVPSSIPQQDPFSFRSSSNQKYSQTSDTVFPPPVPSSPRSTAQTSNSTKHRNSDSYGNISQNSRTSKNSFRKALAAFGLGEKAKVAERERVNEPRLREEKSRTSAMESAKQQGRRVLQYVKRKLNSRTPKEELPKTWEDYGKAYAAQQIDIDDPPLPPARQEFDEPEPTPYEQRVYLAPRPMNEVARQNVVNRLDLFGTRARAGLANPQSPTLHEANLTSSSTPSISNASTASLPLTSNPGPRRTSIANSLDTIPASVIDDGVEVPDSLENSPIFRSIVSRCRDIFGAKVGLLTVLDDEQQLFLAAGGLPEGVDKLPRDVTFCSHAILGDDKGMVVLNTQEDWRFANNLPSTALGARFYAGVPLFARTAGHSSAPSVAIGTLCVADDKPREEFSEAHRRVLRDLGTQASNAIEQWASQRMAIKLARLHGTLPNSSLPDLPKIGNRQTPTSEVPLLTPPSSAGLPAAANASTTSLPARPRTAPVHTPPSPFPASPPQSVRHFEPVHSRQVSDASTSSTIASSVASSVARPSYAQRPATALAFAITTEDPVSLVPRELQKMFDTATKMLAKALSLELCYLAALDLASTSPDGPSLRILSARGLPSPAPSFDPNLHLRALRAPEGGLIYKNPRFIPNGSGSYASGILIPILEVRRVGYVLCGYTQQSEREFVQRDLSYMVKFAEQLEAGVAKLGRSDQVGSMLMARSSSAASASSTGSFRGRFD